MKPWPTCKLDELGFVGRGKSKHRPRNDPLLYGGPYPFFQTGDIKAADLYLRDYSQTYSEAGLAQSKLWQPGTLCITIAANIAETAILGIKGCFPDSVVGFVPNEQKSDVRFVKYYIDTIKLRMQNISRGTTQDNLSVDKLLSFDFPRPPVAVQRSVASVLSAYDDLIENNTRRIQILERMAQALYREWFSNFRFPGHAKVKLVASPLGKIPQGWSVRRLDEVASINASAIQRGHEPKNIFYVDIASVSTGRIEKIEPMAFADAPGRARRIARHGDTIWSCVRPNRKSFSLILNPSADLIVSTGFAVLSPTKVPFSFLHQAVTTNDFVSYLANHATGAAYPAVTAKDFEAAKILLPDESLLRYFNEQCEPMLLLKENLMQKNSNLRRTRDLLLPKLISGTLRLDEKEEAETKIIPLLIQPPTQPVKRTTDEFVEAVLIAQLVRLVATDQYPLGRLRYNKLAYLSHRKAEEDVTERFLKKAAGPYSPWAKYQGPEKIALKNVYVKRAKAGAFEGLVAGDSIYKIDQYLSHYPVCTALDWVVSKFRYRNKADLELLTTVDFAAIDLIRTGAAVTMEAIKHVIATNKEWAPKLNREIFSDENIIRALAELKGLFPRTYAP